MAAETTLALMNCGRAPSTVSIFFGMTKSVQGLAQRGDDLVLGGFVQIRVHRQAHDARAARSSETGVAPAPSAYCS